MRCPRCEFESPSDEECLKCGIVFAKWLKIQDEEEAYDEDDFDDDHEGTVSDADLSKDRENSRQSPRGLPIAANSRELVNVYQSLAHLILTGISPIEAFRMLIPTLSKRFARAAETIVDDLMRGQLLSTAMELHPAFFDARLIAEIRGAERTGHFGECFQRAAERIEAKRSFKRELIRKQWGILVTVVLSILILPIPSLVFGGSGAYASKVLWPLGVLAGCFFFLPWILRLLVRHTFVGDALKRLAWKSPWPATLYVTWIRSHFLDDLSLHLNTGHSLGKSLDSVLVMSEDPVLNQEVRASLARGELNRSLAEVLTAGKAVARVDAVQVTTGERTGTLVHSLAAIATLYRERFHRGLQRFLRVLQVVIVLSAFAFIGWKTMKAYKEARKRVDSAHQILEKEMQRLYRGPAGGLNLPALNLEEMHNERLPEGYQPLNSE